MQRTPCWQPMGQSLQGRHDDQQLLLGMVWAGHVPHLRVRRPVDTHSELVPVQGHRLSYQLGDDPEQTCIGHTPFRKQQADYHDCRRRPQPDSRRCRQCAIVEATFAANLHHAHTRGSAELDPIINQHLDQPNRLYLAAFRDGSIKVGTSTLSRSERRLEEQGAWQARFVAETPNGRAVRHLEDAVTERLGIPQAVSAVRKRRGLIKPVPDTVLQTELSDFAAQVRAIVLEASELQATPLDTHWRHPMAEHPAVAQAIEYPLRITHGRHDLECITAIGRHILARRPGGNDVFLIDPAPLYGIWLDLGDYGSDEIAIQDSLF